MKVLQHLLLELELVLCGPSLWADDFGIRLRFQLITDKRTMSLFIKANLSSGSTDGIGKHTAKKLAKDGATVLVHGRSASPFSH